MVKNLAYVRIHLSLLALLVSTALAGQAQRLLAQKSFALPAALTQVTTNGQGILYMADSKNQVWAYDSLGQQLAYYSPERLLTIAQLIPKAGRKLVLFDRNNQSLITLDRFLVERQVQYLNEWYPTTYIEAAAVADDNQWWFIDINNLRLLKVDAETGRELISISLYDVEAENPIQVNGFWMQNNRLWLLSGSELLQFDRLGNFQQTHHLPPATRYQPTTGRLYFLLPNDTLGWLDTATQEVKQIVYPGLNRYTTLTGDLHTVYLFDEATATPLRVLPTK